MTPSSYAGYRLVAAGPYMDTVCDACGEVIVRVFRGAVWEMSRPLESHRLNCRARRARKGVNATPPEDQLSGGT